MMRVARPLRHRCLRVVQVVEMAEKKKDRKAARETESMVFEYRSV